MNRKDFQALAQTRLNEARALAKAGLPDGAYYLAGYVVECALKACIAKNTKRYDFPDKARVEESYTHNLKRLIKPANLEVELEKTLEQDDIFRGNWRVVQLWSEQSRYRRHDLASAQELLDAVGNRNHGVFAWIKRYW